MKRHKPQRIKTKRRANASIARKKHGGFASGLELKVSKRLKNLRISSEYETEQLPFVVERNYTPDFILEVDGEKVYLEVKGYLSAEDITKMIRVRKQHPEKRIIFLFQKPHQRVGKTKSTHAEWAERNGYEWLDAQTFRKRDIF